MVAAKAFDELERRIGKMDEAGTDYSIAKRSACVGVVKSFVSNHAADELREAMRILASDKNSTSKSIFATVKKWAAEVNVYV